MKHSTRIVAALVVACGALLGPAAGAMPRATAVPHIDDLLRVDPLGYDCIAEGDLESAFRAAGKPFQLPRTCLPDPCARQLSRAGLAQVLGRAADVALWDDYVARYAQTCVHEALWPGEVRVASTAAASDAAAFWAPLRRDGSRGSGSVAWGDDDSGEGDDETDEQERIQFLRTFSDPEEPQRPQDKPDDRISPVPLPPAILFLLSGLLGFGLVRRLS